MKCLKVKRFLQDTAACAYAATASIGNFFDKRIDYDLICSLSKPDGQGLYTPEICMLLNKIGFTQVTVVTADIGIFDFKWQNVSRKQMIDELKEVRRRHPDCGYRDVGRAYVKWLENWQDDNEIKLDLTFGDHIRKQLSSGSPLLASFNWNMFFHYPKCDENREIDPIKGEFENHEVLLYGFNKNSVKVLDSHHELYKRGLKKYACGRYEMKWETLMTVMGQGDLIIPGGFDKERLDVLVSKIKP
jgi:hypothetical protein